MSSYLLTVVGTALISSVLIAILPSGKTSEIIKAILRTACLVVILSPLATLFVELKNNHGIFVESSIETHDNFIEYSCKRRVEEAEKMLAKELNERFGGIRLVEAVWGFEDVEVGTYSVEEIQIKELLIKTEYLFSAKESEDVRVFLLEHYGCESSVVLSGD